GPRRPAPFRPWPRPCRVGTIGGDFERSASVPRHRPDDLGRARDGSCTVPSPPPRRSPLPEADSDPTGHQPRPDRRPAAQGVLPMVLPLPFLTRRPTVPAKDGASWPHVVILGGGFAGAHAVKALRDARVRVTL